MNVNAKVDVKFNFHVTLFTTSCQVTVLPDYSFIHDSLHRCVPAYVSRNL